MSRPGRTLFCALLACFALMAGACGRDDGRGEAAGDETATTTAAGTAKLKVVTTVAPLTSIAANVAGDRADIEGVVPEGTNSHTFEPAPRVAEILAEADLIFINGLVLEEPTKDLAEA
ncbi:MAG: metal ABC transporter substrate-binding protein, partial [Acidimicrobiia bacterium]